MAYSSMGSTKEENLEVLLLQGVEEWGLLDSLERFASDVVHVASGALAYG